MVTYQTMADEDITEIQQRTSRRRRSTTTTRKKVRWADEEQTQTPWLIIVVVVLNGIFGLLAVLSRWGLLWSPATNNSSPSIPSLIGTWSVPQETKDVPEQDNLHEIRDIKIIATPSANAANHAGVRAWAGMVRKRQASASSSSSTTTSASITPSASATFTALPAFDPIQAFQIDIPLLGPGGSVVGGGTPNGFSGIQTSAATSTTAACEVTLAVNTFANSFGSPFVGNYTPPACLASSNANTAVMNLTVLSQGRQFDRLFIV